VPALNRVWRRGSVACDGEAPISSDSSENYREVLDRARRIWNVSWRSPRSRTRPCPSAQEAATRGEDAGRADPRSERTWRGALQPRTRACRWRQERAAL